MTLSDFPIDPDDLIDAVSRDDNTGFCLECGNEQLGVEPDARGYRCQSCGVRRVCGAEAILIRFAKD